VSATNTAIREENPNWWADANSVSLDELGLAARNHGMPLEGLAYDVTPLGMHYLLTHFDVSEISEDTWSLEIGGHVEHPQRLTLEEISSRPRSTQVVTMECAGNGRARIAGRMKSQPWLEEAVGTASWTGTALWGLLESAGVKDGAVEVLFTGFDRGIQGGVEHDYERSIPVAEARRSEVILAYEINGRPLPPQHGFPLRVVVPDWYGMTNVKWLRSITVLKEPFRGFQQVTGYTIRTSPESPGIEVTKMQPRSLMIPPGIPEFVSRVRYATRSAQQLRGRAWSGLAPIARVEVSVDGGRTWDDAILGPPAGPHAWTPWSYSWEPREPGEYQLQSRATDAAGNGQPFLPVDADNPQGLANNGIHSVRVIVR
jgi:DMSO/TMAO reductase YedYZ molybdopterin-dependent catalytic subunit